MSVLPDSAPPPEVSVTIPLLNERENLAQLWEELAAAFGPGTPSVEFLFVDDGSTDGTDVLLQELARGDARVRVIRLRRNFGQTAALMAGFDHARGRILVALDGDCQNDPADIPRLLEKLAEGYDVVCGWRKVRQDAAIRRNLVSRVANRLIVLISGVSLHDYGCTLKAYRTDLMKDVRLYGEMHRFIPIFAQWQGARLVELAVNHRPRTRGASKYGLERIPKVLLDLLVVKFLHDFSQKPMYVFGGFGMGSFAVSGLSVLAAFYYKFFGHKSFIETPLPLLAAMSFLVGVMCVLMGLLAEMLVRTYYESQQKRTYVVAPTEERD